LAHTYEESTHMKLLPPIFHFMLLFLAWPSSHVSHPHAHCTGSDGSTSVSGLCRTYIFCVRTAEPLQQKSHVKVGWNACLLETEQKCTFAVRFQWLL